MARAISKTSEVVVIGGGIAGVCITYALAKRGVRKVILCEKDGLGNGASGYSSALIRMHYTNEWEARLALASFPGFTNFETMMGERMFTQTGCVYLVGPEYAENLRANVKMLQGIGVNTEVLTPPEVKALQPFVNVSDVGAVAFEPAAGFCAADRVIQCLRRCAEELGASISQWTRVTRIVHKGDRVEGVETELGQIEAPVVIVAAGAWSPTLFRELGVALPARTKALDTAIVIRPEELFDPHMTFIDNIQGTYFRPDTGLLTIVGVPCQKWDVDPDGITGSFPTTAGLEAAQILTHRIPAMAGGALQSGYRACDCYSPDRCAILDAVEEIRGLYVATAFSGSGFKIALAVGTCMAELILDGEATTCDIRPFGLRRFKEGKPLKGQFPYAVRRDHIEPLQYV